jgi:hypothetical protein
LPIRCETIDRVIEQQRPAVGLQREELLAAAVDGQVGARCVCDEVGRHVETGIGRHVHAHITRRSHVG